MLGIRSFSFNQSILYPSNSCFQPVTRQILNNNSRDPSTKKINLHVTNYPLSEKMHGFQVFCYLGGGVLAFIFCGIFIKYMAYVSNRINIQRQAAVAGVAATRGSGFQEVEIQSSSSRVEVVTDETAINSEGINERKGSLSNCIICICEIEDGELCWELTRCNHTFHAECIQKWLKKSKTCPLCRTVIVIHV